MLHTHFGPPNSFKRIQITLCWDGTHFKGWQSQAKGERTVQDTLFETLMVFGEARKPVAAGRTDTGVHAQRMPIHVDLIDNYPIPIERLAHALNHKLPHDISVLDAQYAPLHFHARHSCLWRHYLYRIHTHPCRSPLEHNRALWVPYELDLAKLNIGLQQLIGTHDFKAFSSKEDRTTRCTLLNATASQSNNILELEFRGRSFLRHMVRGMVGALLQLGRGNIAPHDIEKALQGNPGPLGPNANPCGLYFMGAGYPHRPEL
ncbi:MAG: tRNA pseudouridine(38-40) synthase TruA [Deinococcaceae bacterium]